MLPRFPRKSDGDSLNLIRNRLGDVMPSEKRHLCFNLRKGSRKASLLEIFLKFLPHDFVTRIANDIPDMDLKYYNGWCLRLSTRKTYLMLALKIRIYDGQQLPVGVKARSCPLRCQIQQFMQHFEEKYAAKLVGIRSCKLFFSHFLIDSSYLEEFSNNFMSIVRHMGTYYVAGDEKLLRLFGESDNVRVVFSKPDRVDFGSIS